MPIILLLFSVWVTGHITQREFGCLIKLDETEVPVQCNGTYGTIFVRRVGLLYASNPAFDFPILLLFAFFTYAYEHSYDSHHQLLP